MCHPAVKVHQGSAQQGPVIGPVEGPLATVALPWVGVLWWKVPRECCEPPKW